MADGGMETEIGARLRQVRQAAGLSQRELARRAGVTNGTVSLIEQNRTSPSVASLRRVLQGIPMTLAEFFSMEVPDAQRLVFRASELIEIGHAAAGGHDIPVSLRQVGDARRYNLQVLEETYAPGADTGRSMLQHDSTEGGLVIEGRMELTIGTDRTVLGPGDGYLFDSRIPHRFRNPFEAPCRIVSACTPPYL
jgi:transcriptional regulator with XRE-family HTH domain